MISAVARVYMPGCKADCALVLEGPQGIGKSTALRNLAQPWFTDEIAAFGTKDAAEQTIGVWIVELSELDAVTRAADIAHVKAFMSRQKDRFRMSYGHRVGEYPRQCVFAATSNSSTWNRDDTGGRRWWPLTCGVIRAAALREDRDQLWAEARDRFHAGEVWHLDTPEITAAAEAEQEDRSVEDPLTATVMNEVAGDRVISTAELMSRLNIPKERQNRAEAMRFGSILRQAGWTRKRYRVAGGVAWRFEAPKNE
jgi:predicted P-loop ATPase